MEMDPSEAESAGHHLLFFILLSLFLVIAGAHLLETVCHSIGLTDAKPLITAPNSEDSADGAGGLSLASRAYRYGVAIAFLFLGYHCYSIKEWARRLMVVVLVTDLGVWIISTVYSTLLTGQTTLAPTQVAVQLVVVLVESSLLWILTHPATTVFFAPRSRNGRSVPR